MALFTAAALAQPVRTEHAQAELIAATDAIVPGKPLSVALRIKHDEGWHTYWQVPGDSGLPTRITWHLPAGWRASPLNWPLPKRLRVGPLVNYGYEGEVLLLAELMPPATLALGEAVTLAARADWLICKDICIPDGADLKLALPVRADAAPSRWASQFAHARAQVPQPLALPGAEATIEDDRIRLAFAVRGSARRFEFFPLEEGRIEAAAPQPVRIAEGRVALYLTATRPVAPQFHRLKGVLVAEGGPANAERGGWAGQIDVPLRAGSVPAAEASLAAAAITGEPGLGLWLALGGAFLGGLILNLMPCVFPVLSLKLLSLVQHQRAEDAARIAHPSLRAHGFAYAAGVVASFVALAALLLVLRAAGTQLGWGFQLQTPAVVAALAALFFVIGLNLLGAFEVSWGSGLANLRAARDLRPDSLAGSVGTGVLAVVVAAPCTAPFMGAALGYAMTQPPAVALTVFAALGAGMAAPYLLLTLWPRLLARLPRPGVWMLRFKQAMAFPMFGTVVWLLWVLAQQIGADGLGLTLAALVLLGLAAWALGLSQQGARGARWLAAGAAALGLYAVALATQAPTAPRARAGASADLVQEDAWQPWSQAAMQRALTAGRPVFVDFTAAWCITCQANKRLVLTSDSVLRAFAEKGVVPMRADWTNRDEEITRELARFQRNGVPLYVLYRPDGSTQVLPELLTRSVVLQALQAL
ncbi:MAG: thioredoxin family protein [Sutterellaceae bacterium]|nr:thioredoxin family protein [Burkholderiaceae bacterium]MDW8430040.1 thioredoxin family protein [Sutterellaceae bacterium]